VILSILSLYQRSDTSLFSFLFIPAGCSENPDELGNAPSVETGWVPDVTMVRKMMIYGKDRDGNQFPPPLSKELCEDIGVFGEKTGDTNKECLRKTMIHPTGPLNSTTVTIDPFNHFGHESESDSENGSLTVPAPKVMCLVYTMANAHANRIRAMRDTWAGGCDGFLAFSTESDPRLPAISIEHEGPEEYGNVCVSISLSAHKEIALTLINYCISRCGKKSEAFGSLLGPII
jgi:hypothetical protein